VKEREVSADRTTDDYVAVIDAHLCDHSPEVVQKAIH
jgi:hypothetical protein